MIRFEMHPLLWIIRPPAGINMPSSYESSDYLVRKDYSIRNGWIAQKRTMISVDEDDYVEIGWGSSSDAAKERCEEHRKSSY